MSHSFKSESLKTFYLFTLKLPKKFIPKTEELSTLPSSFLSTLSFLRLAQNGTTPFRSLTPLHVILALKV